MADVADLIMRASVQGGRESVQTLDELDKGAQRAERSAESLGTEQTRLARQLKQAEAAMKAQQAAVNASNVVNLAAARSSRLAGHEVANLSRQMGDLATMAALGASPMMILTTQGFQVAEIFGIARARGVTLTSALGQLAAMAGRLALRLAPLAIVAGAAFGGAALAARALDKEVGNLTEGMGLTKKQLEELKEQGVDTGVTIGDVFRGTFNYIGGAVGQALAPVGRWFSELFDKITKGAITAIRTLVGGFAGAFAAIRETWRMFPAVIGDVVISGVNAAIRAINSLIERAVSGINGLVEKANALGARLPKIAGFAVSEVSNPWSGAAAQAWNDGSAAAEAGAKAALAWLDQVGKDWNKAVLDAAKKRILEEAGKPGKSARDPRDTTDERTAQIEAMLQQALAEQLQAQLALTKDVKDRARIEKQLLAAELAQRQAQIDRQIAGIEDDKGLSSAKKAQLIQQLEQVKLQNVLTGILKGRAVDEKASEALAKQAHDLAVAQREANIAVLESQLPLARTTLGRARVVEEILKAEHALERMKLEEIVASEHSTQAQKDIARARLAVLGLIQENELKAHRESVRLADVFNEFAGHVDGAARAFGDRDWVGLARALEDGFKALREALAKGEGKFAALAGIADGIGRAIGGTAGSTISGAAQGAQIGMTLGGPIGAGIGAVVGGIAGFLSGSSAAKRRREEERRRRQEEEARRIEELRRTRFDMDLRLMELQGRSAEALAFARERELGVMDASLHELQKQIWALEDKAEAERKAADLARQRDELTLRIMEMNGEAAAALAIRRQMELAAMDESLRPLQQLLWAREDEAAALEQQARTAEEAARAQEAALQRQIEINRTRDQFVLQIMELNGEGAAALAIRRRLELEAMDASLRPLQELLWARQDERAILEENARIAAEAARVAEEAARAQEEAAARAREAQLALAKTNDDLWLSILDMADPTRARAERRSRDLAGADPSTRALLEVKFALEDLADITARAKEQAEAARAVAMEHADLQARLAGLQGNDAPARMLERQREMEAALDDYSRALLQAIYAQEDANRALEEQRAATERLLALQNETRDLNIRLLEATGQSEAALALQRQRELEALDPLNRALMATIWAVEDAAAAESRLAEERQRAQEAADRIQDLNARLAELSGNSGLATVIRRTRELRDASSDAERAMLQQIYAQENLNAANEERTRQLDGLKDQLREAYDRERDLLETRIESYRGFERSLRDFALGLETGPFAMLTGEARYSAARQAFLSGAGDPERAQSVMEAFLEASRDYYGATEPYFRDLELVKKHANATADWSARIADRAEQQLGMLSQQVGQLIDLNANVIGVQQSIHSLQVAMGVLSAPGGSVRAAGYIRDVPQFASGGLHFGGARIVGEEGAELEVTGPARYFSAEQTREMFAGNDNGEMSALRKEVAELRRELVSAVKAGNRQRGAAAEAMLARLEALEARVDRQTRKQAAA